jgi:hypothetical protein
MKVNIISEKLMRFPEIPWYNTLLSFSFDVLSLSLSLSVLSKVDH